MSDKKAMNMKCLSLCVNEIATLPKAYPIVKKIRDQRNDETNWMRMK